MAALVCPRCWTYYTGDQKQCTECGGRLITAERVGVYGGGRLDFAAETTPGLFAALEFLDLITFLRAALIVNGLLVLALLHMAVGDITIGRSFFGPFAQQIQTSAAQMNYVYIAVGLVFAWTLLVVRFKTARLVVILAYIGTTATATFFAVTNGIQPIVFLALVSMVTVAVLTSFSLRSR